MGLAISSLPDVDDAVEFQEVILRRDLWRRQRDIARSVMSNPITAVKGCHASGKTYMASGLPIWWLAKYPRGKVLQVSPTLRQVKIFWSEVETARREMAVLKFPECTTTGLKINEACYAGGASSSKGINLQGYHAPQMLIICDECPGIIADVWEAIRGVTAGGFVRQLRLGNPTVPSGQFFEDFRSERVNGITISAFDTPNLYNRAERRPYTIEEILAMDDATLDEAPVPYLATRRFVRDAYLDWGPEHPAYVSRVLGQFPAQSDWAVFSLDWIERANRDATEAELKTARGHWIQVGIDVAAGGDAETVAYARVDGIILRMKTWTDQDPGGKIIAWLKALRHEFAGLYPMGPVLVDMVGPGLHLGPRIASEGFECYGFQAGAKAVDADRFENAKAEAYWQCREWFRDGAISGLEDQTTRSQLAGILYKETHRGKTMIEPKEEARKRGVKSPDRAEALIMSLKPIIPESQQQDCAMHGRVVIPW